MNAKRVLGAMASMCVLLANVVLTVGSGVTATPSGGANNPNPYSPPPASFQATLTPAEVAVLSRSSAITRLRITPAGGFTGTVALALVGAPAGLRLSPTSIQVPGALPVEQELTVAAVIGQGPGGSTSVAPGTYGLTLSATSGDLSASVPLSVTVTRSGPVSPDVALSTPTTFFRIPADRAMPFDVTITPMGGVAGPLTLTAPAAAGIVVEPAAVTLNLPGDDRPLTQRFTVRVPPAASIQAFSIVASGSATRTLNLSAAAVAPADVFIGAGGSQTGTTLLSLAGAGYAARADIARGEFAVLRNGFFNAEVSAGLGAGEQFILANRTGAPITLPAGALRLEIDGRYLYLNGTTLESFIAFNLQRFGGSGGGATGSIVHRITGNTDALSAASAAPAGMTVNITRSNWTSLVATIETPQLTVAPDELLGFNVQVRAVSANSESSIDYFTVPVRLCMNRTAVALLLDNAAVAPDWCQ